ncbi:signal peptidase I [Brachybacterium sp. EF45031]|uniref:signal peptidase I n=1 Tax=Brachybacterium sillae TaxID=2810536 RepID=UPI00217D8945|nr:signal peptidase I [Brachybacterium sillae]MCS6712323.1 signal peptidase I [Brachybacterium sillae]
MNETSPDTVPESVSQPAPDATPDSTAESAPNATPGSTGASTASGRRADRSARRGSVLEYLLTMVVALLIAVLVKTFLVQPFYIPSASMHPTLLENDKILVSKLSPGVFDLERGDVVVFEDPGDWVGAPMPPDSTRYRAQKVLSFVGLVPDPSQSFLVKRLAGLPGDRVTCTETGGDVSVNGTPVTEPYIAPGTGACQTTFDVTVPQDSVWVLGDNRFQSGDSAWHQAQNGNGFVPLEDVTGRAVVVFWPLTRWETLGEGRDAFADVPAAQ